MYEIVAYEFKGGEHREFMRIPEITSDEMLSVQCQRAKNILTNRMNAGSCVGGQVIVMEDGKERKSLTITSNSQVGG